MSKIVYCPLATTTREKKFLYECLRAACAWWDENANQCAVRRLAGLVDLAEREDKRKQGEAAINFDKLLKRWVK